MLQLFGIFITILAYEDSKHHRVWERAIYDAKLN